MIRIHARRNASALKSAALLGALAACGLLAQTAQADAKAGVDAWSRAEAASAAGNKVAAQREYAAAIHEWQADADKGDPDAQFNLGQAYKWGKGVPQDLTRAEVLFAKAAAKGHTQAADNYGLLLFQRGQHAQAMPYLQAAADRGEKGALYLLGIAHFNGENVPKDWVRAYALETIANQPVDGQPPLPQARAALAQMDKFISMEDRQRGASLASELSTQIEANRQRQFASNDLGNTVTPPPAGASAPAPAPVETPHAAAPSPAPVVKAPSPPKDKPTPKPAPRPTAPSETPNPAATHTPPAPKTAATKPVPDAPKPAPAKPAPAKPVPVSGNWKIQLGAFGVPANVDAQWAKASRLPEVAGHPRQNVPTGKVTRLMAGGYSEESAKAACRKLVAAGITCIPAQN
ncbi:SPOR domain-containing protein [Novosphingobium rosa]|uniref:SPOR domain-containing protein n=1 Tax=Novosphingobium rosa TaxID=76978 RepID=UPI00082EF570|nr:SPOR domain-containing protein [Novosphingobium rosa]